MQQKIYVLFSCSSCNEQQNILQTATEENNTYKKKEEGNRIAHAINWTK